MTFDGSINDESGFDGPLFIVGMPRSGTKLLRDLLNQNPKISIPTVESHFIPFMLNRFVERPDFMNGRGFDEFYEEFTHTPFYQNMKAKGRILTKQALVSSADIKSWSSIFKTILIYYAPTNESGFIWGDKTPGYITHMPLLKNLFPEAKFLHIIRDPRDYCLSVKKTWGKHIYRAANSWRKTLEKSCLEGRRLGIDYKEVFYEQLLSDPSYILKDICLFMGCEYTSSMTSLDKPAENLGDTKGKKIIVRDNTRKYRNQFKLSQVERIEEIVYPMAVKLGYKLEYATSFKPVNKSMLNLYKLFDGWASMKFHINEKGLWSGLNYFVSFHSRSSWR